MAQNQIGKTLVIFVRGFRGVNGGVGLRGEFKTQLNRFLTTSGHEPAIDLSIVGLPALRAMMNGAPGRAVDIVEIDWEPTIGKLSDQQVVRRILTGLYLMARGFIASWAALGSFGFFYLTFLNCMVILSWLYLAIAAGLGALDKLKTDSTVSVPHPAWLATIYHALLPHGVPFVVATLFVGFLTALGVSSDLIVNMADTYVRYLNNGRGLTSRQSLHESLVQLAFTGAVAARRSDTYERFVVLGHSFGAVIAVEAASRLATWLAEPDTGLDGAVELVTVGTFFNYLRAINATALAGIMTNADAVSRWRDFFSPQDAVANSRPFAPAPKVYKGQRIDLRPVTPWQIITTETHAFYFRDNAIFEAILNAGEPSTVQPEDEIGVVGRERVRT